jgi:hypothetical protein
MKKFAFAVLIAAVAASPAMAAKKAKKAAAQPTVAELNDPGFRFVRDSLPMYYPSIIKAAMYPVGNKEK